MTLIPKSWTSKQMQHIFKCTLLLSPNMKDAWCQWWLSSPKPWTSNMLVQAYAHISSNICTLVANQCKFTFGDLV